MTGGHPLDYRCRAEVGSKLHSLDAKRTQSIDVVCKNSETDPNQERHQSDYQDGVIAIIVTGRLTASRGLVCVHARSLQA